LPWGHTRSYSNQQAYDYDCGNGWNWLVREWPYLGELEDGTIFIVRGARNVRFFTESGGTYSPKFGTRDTLTFSSGTNEFNLNTSEGQQWVFHGLDGPQPRGLLKRLVTSGGQTINLSYTGAILTEASWSFVDSSAQTVIERFVYEYLQLPDPNAGRLSSVTLTRKIGAAAETSIRRASYGYHTGATANGSLGDLEGAVIEINVAGTWTVDSGYYYRYYKDAAGGIGFAHGVKFVVGPEAYLRMFQAFIDPRTATDSQLAQYADYYFEYDPASRRVTEETVDGGDKSFGFTYSQRSTTDEDYNHWYSKTVETRPTGGGQLTVYTNFIGQVLLRQLTDGTKFWCEYYKYDANGRLEFEASPSAVLSYNDSSADLGVTLKTNDGLIRIYTYYTSDSSTAASGYLHYAALKQGTLGTEIRLREYEYGTRTGGGVTIRPITKEIVYRNENGTGGIATSFTYTWYSGTVQTLERRTILPAVPTNQNGTNTQAERWERFDVYGNLEWVKDGRGYITRHKYDPTTQSLIQTIEDTNAGLPSGWTALSGSHLNLTTDYAYDQLGRQVEVLGPVHDINAANVRTATWTVYIDGIPNEIWVTQGYKEGATDKVTSPPAPVSIQKIDKAGRVFQRIVSKRDPNRTSAKLSATEDYGVQSRWVRWSVEHFTDQSLHDYSRVYHLIPSSGEGVVGTNYNVTRFLYDAMDRQIGVKSPGGTITRTKFDVRNLQTEQWIGTNDNGFAAPNFDSSGTNNMRLVTAFEYDGGVDKANGNLTKLTQPVDATSANDRVTQFVYDFRNRRTNQTGPKSSSTVLSWTYDNLDRVVQTLRGSLSPLQLLSLAETKFDERGQVYQTINYEVPVGSTNPGTPLTDNFWFDNDGREIKSVPAGSSAFTKTQYDGVGRASKEFRGYGTSPPDSVASDTIFLQSEGILDDAGNQIQITTRRRFHNATSTTGELQNPSTEPRARVTYVATWHDQIGRPAASANYGDNGGSTLSRPTSAPPSSDTILVTTTQYDEAGHAFQVVDPAGRESRQEFDQAGRRTKLINNYIDGDPSTGPPDEDQTTLWTYTADSLVATLTAKNSVTGDQTTTYFYGSTLTESQVARADLLREIAYPDSSGTSDRVIYEYNRQGQTKKLTDQNGTVHEFDYDKAGMQTADRVTTLGSGIDGTVRRIETTYNLR